MRRIKNFDALARSKARADILNIIEVGYAAIDNETRVRDCVQLAGDTLTVDGTEVNLKLYKRVFVVAFGKGSGVAANALVDVLSGRVSGGVVVDRTSTVCPALLTCVGSHPMPSEANLEATNYLQGMVKDISEQDLVLVIVAGGGSSLFCYPASECEQGQKVYKAFLPTGATIHEMNLVRKHISGVKGGGLVKMLYPARVVGLIFSDVLGAGESEVASGPSYPDFSTIADAKFILAKYKIPDDFVFNETPKEPKYFDKVTNHVLVSNQHALIAMAAEAKLLGYEPLVISEPLYNYADEARDIMIKVSRPGAVVIAGGEIRLKIAGGGRGGRCSYLGLVTAPNIGERQVFAAFASDGTDNGPEAGVMADYSTSKLIPSDIDKRDTVTPFEQTGDVLVTGQLASNVSDIYLLLTEHKEA